MLLTEKDAKEVVAMAQTACSHAARAQHAVEQAELLVTRSVNAAGVCMELAESVQRIVSVLWVLVLLIGLSFAAWVVKVFA